MNLDLQNCNSISSHPNLTNTIHPLSSFKPPSHWSARNNQAGVFFWRDGYVSRVNPKWWSLTKKQATHLNAGPAPRLAAGWQERSRSPPPPWARLLTTFCEKIADPLKKESFTTRGSINCPQKVAKRPPCFDRQKRAGEPKRRPWPPVLRKSYSHA